MSSVLRVVLQSQGLFAEFRQNSVFWMQRVILFDLGAPLHFVFVELIGICFLRRISRTDAPCAETSTVLCAPTCRNDIPPGLLPAISPYRHLAESRKSEYEDTLTVAKSPPSFSPCPRARGLPVPFSYQWIHRSARDNMRSKVVDPSGYYCHRVAKPVRNRNTVNGCELVRIKKVV